MKYNRIISAAVMCLLLGSTLPAFAQKEEEKGGGKPQAAQHEQQSQHAQKAQPQHRAEHAQPQQHAQKAQPQQRTEKAQPQQRAEKAQPQEARQSRGQQQQTVAYHGGNSSNHGNNGNHYGRISDASYHSHFGHDHSFHMGHPEMRGGYNRFQYGGYSFGYNQRWPEGWGYNDDFYVEYIDGAYFLSDLRFPGVQITLNIF